MFKIKKRNSLTVRILIVMTVAIIIAIGIFAAVREFGNFLVWRYYLNDEEKQERLDGYMEELNEYIAENELSVDDTDKMSKLFEGRYVDIVIYKDSKLIYAPEWFEAFGQGSDSADGAETTSPILDETVETEHGGEINTEENTEVYTEGEASTDVASEMPADTEITDEGSPETAYETDTAALEESSAALESAYSDANSDVESMTNLPIEDLDSWFTGDRSFVQYLTEEARAEYQSALNNILEGNAELKPINCVGGTLLVTMVDYSEDFVYNLVTVISLICAILVVAIIMAWNLSKLVSRVTRLATDVKYVGEGNLDTPIAIDGKDEIASLAFDVNSMRNSIIDKMTQERRAWEANSSLITAMSHDIRTPLTVLLGYLDLMELQNSDKTNAEYISTCKENALRLKRLSDDMFSYFLVFGREGVELETVESLASESIEFMIAEHILLLEENGYRILREGAIPAVKVNIDNVYFSRVVDNIFSNIGKYASSDEPIKIDSVFDGKDLTVIFENKIKIDSKTAESNRIGIKTCVKIMEQMGGSFIVDECDGSFRVTLKMPAESTEKK